jgi:hypothetical protein
VNRLKQRGWQKTANMYYEVKPGGFRLQNRDFQNVTNNHLSRLKHMEFHYLQSTSDNFCLILQIEYDKMDKLLELSMENTPLKLEERIKGASKSQA